MAWSVSAKNGLKATTADSRKSSPGNGRVKVSFSAGCWHLLAATERGLNRRSKVGHDMKILAPKQLRQLPDKSKVQCTNH